jgi:hypothetical protein
VGILDAFMDSKGIVTRKEWSGWCSETVPLAEFDGYCWSLDDTFTAEVKVAHFNPEEITGVSWTIGFDGKEFASGHMAPPSGEGLLDVGEIQVDLTAIPVPSRGNLCVKVLTGGEHPREYANDWPLWLYSDENMPDKSGVTVARQLDEEVKRTLDSGGKVLLMPSETAGTVGGLFQTDYWNYRMFKRICENNGKPVSPGTLGILTDPRHPLFEEFPTGEHTDWQWFPVIKESHPVILDGLDGITPIVQVIDNIERNHKLGLLYEVPVEKGRLLVCASDLEQVLDYPEGRQFYTAVLDYLRSDKK